MRFILPFFIFFLSFLSFSQTQLTLQLVDEQNNAVEYANFRLFSPKDSSVVAGEYTDLMGEISIKGIAYGEYYAIITFFGFEDKVMNDLVFSADKRKLDLGTVTLNKLNSQEFDENVWNTWVSAVINGSYIMGKVI